MMGLKHTMKCAVFPGQGNQYIGMGYDLFEAHPQVRELYNEACRVLGKDIITLSFQGPKEEQRKTENLQLLTYLHSAAIYLTLKDKGINFDITAGHSIGELCALMAADAFSFETGVEIVAKRGELMSKVHFDQAPLAVIRGMDLSELEELCAGTGGRIAIALYNGPQNYVIGGAPEDLQQFIAVIKEKGGKIIPLQVSGPFHTLHYRKTANEFKATLQRIAFNKPEIPVIANVNAQPYGCDDIIENLTTQLYLPVLWQQTIEMIRSVRCNTFVEIGPGDSLTKMIQGISPEAKIYTINNAEAIEKYAEELATIK